MRESYSDHTFCKMEPDFKGFFKQCILFWLLEELLLLTFYPLRLHAEEVGTCSTVIETFSHLTKLLS